MDKTNMANSLAYTLLLLGGNVSWAQDDLTRPPRITDTPPATTRLTPLAQSDTQAAIEEVLVVRENPWRLPDLGSDWRAQQAARQTTGRIETDLLPLYDPESEEPFDDSLLLNRELQRTGFIEVFRLKFGRR